MIKKLDQYLIKRFWLVLSLSIIGFISIFIIVDLIENIDRFMDNHVPLNIIIKYYIYTLPWFINIGLPMSVLISTVFSFGTIVKDNEWTAMKASGISIYRITIPLILSGIFISACSFFLDNKLVSYGNEKRFEIDRDYVKRKSRHKTKSILKNVLLQKNISKNIVLEKYFIKDFKGLNLTLIDLKKSTIVRRIDSKKIIWNKDSLKWKLNDYSIRNFNKSGIEINTIINKKDSLISLGFEPSEIQQQAKKPDELDYYQLTNLIIRLKGNSIDTIRWEVARYMKISFAFTNLVVVLFGIPLTVFKTKNSLSFGIGTSVLVIFCYYAFIKFGQTLGYNGVLIPLMSAWLGNIIFTICGLLLLLKAKT